MQIFLSYDVIRCFVIDLACINPVLTSNWQMHFTESYAARGRSLHAKYRVYTSNRSMNNEKMVIECAYERDGTGGLQEPKVGLCSAMQVSFKVVTISL